MTDSPIACSLTKEELVERRRNVSKRLETKRLELRELPDGLAFRFAPSSEELLALVQIIDLERQCCPFLTFRLTIEPQQGPVWLELTGPPGTREMLRSELALG